jgi:hypothetical protein
VKTGKKQDGVGELSMHPEILVERDEANLGSDPAHNGSAYREENKHAVHAED